MPDEIRAEGFVRPGYQCADEDTASWVQAKAEELVGRKAETPKTGPKYFACLTDCLRTLQTTPSGLIAWPMNDEHYRGAPYGRDVAQKMKAALIGRGQLVEVQRPSLRLCSVFQARFDDLPDWLSFRKSRPVSLVKVRAPSLRVQGKLRRGRQIPMKRFDRRTVEPLVQDMKTINDMMEHNPLLGPDGSMWDSCCRQFNGGDETGREWRNLGGRIYGDWQNRSSDERLHFQLGGEPVCEIDLKACYLSMANLMADEPVTLPADPYQAIGFVCDLETRELAKRLVNAVLCKDGPVTRFPRGQNGASFRDEFDISTRVKVADYLDDIYSAFPFLKGFHLDGLELMYRESELMVQSLLKLAQVDVPAYPVHDCLICRRSDEPVAVDFLRQVMKDKFGGVVGLEVEVEGEEPRLVVLE